MSDSTDYVTLAAQASGLLSGHRNRVSNAANLGALIYQEIPAISWVGFYFLEGDQLALGPFQGKPACVNIPLGQGVCGTAAATREIQRVADVHEFAGHIACDVKSRSELVIPLVKNGNLIGVLDLDSPEPDRFSRFDAAGVASLARIYLDSVD